MQCMQRRLPFDPAPVVPAAFTVRLMMFSAPARAHTQCIASRRHPRSTGVPTEVTETNALRFLIDTDLDDAAWASAWIRAGARSE